ncbi:MaoC family dehydratase [Nocardioides seonyuensis]|uniref:MaoC family dehydratase n=1 Tax=Nocardioides seonyuensis TaxID=2518371 RepID=UPI001ABED7A0|nr:MaoC family dehydratase [Nocardioides seonyuensis]
MSAHPDRVRAVTTPEVIALKGRTLGPTAWFPVLQDRVDAFARAVEDWHWAHDDVERASRGPFGGTIAHAHLTLGLVPHLFASLVGFAEGEDAMFYGYNKVRFPTAVPVGSSLRMSATIVEVVDLGGGEELTVDLLMEVDGVERPACAAQAVFRHYAVKAPD